jgi:hypothetical protein
MPNDEYQLIRFEEYHDGERVSLKPADEIIHTHEEDNETLTFWIRRRASSDV